MAADPADKDKTSADQTAANKAAADARATADKAAADARVAADKAAAADQKAAEQQMLADQKAAANELLKTPVIIAGTAGSAFSIDGPGLGDSGTLTIGGRVIPTTRWEDRTIRGQLPQGVRGDVVLTTPTGVRKGVFPHVRKEAVKTTTVTTEVVPTGTQALHPAGTQVGAVATAPGTPAAGAGTQAAPPPTT